MHCWLILENRVIIEIWKNRGDIILTSLSLHHNEMLPWNKLFNADTILCYLHSRISYASNKSNEIKMMIKCY